MNFQNKVAFVTGGANGIGLGLAKAVARRGAKVAIADVQEEALTQAVSAIKELGVDAFGIRLDVRDRTAVYGAADQVEKKFGRVDFVFNNAGIGDAGTPLEQLSYEYIDWILNVNLVGVINVMKAFVPKLRKQGAGSYIVNTSSLAGLVLMPGWNQGLYSATKMAVLALTLDLRHVLKEHGIGVSALCPGGVETNIAKNAVSLRPSDVKDAIPVLPEELTKLGMSADQLAEIVLSGMESNKAIIVSHPQYWPAVQEFHESIRSAFQA